MKDKSKALIPKLRFSEFKGGPGWEEGKLGDVVSTITPPKKLPTSSYRTKGSIPIVDQSPELVCGWTDDAEAVIESSKPLIVFGDHTCVLKLVRGPFAQGADGIKIFHSEPFIDTEYLFHNLSNRPLAMEDYKRHFSSLRERRIHYPDPRTAEQRKIAACLTSVDEWIAAEGRKLEALRAHKKGLMQQLFPREGETRPRRRFPEFRDGPKWEDKKLEDLAQRGSGHTPNKGKSEYYSGGIKWVSLADSRRLDRGLISETEIEISEQGIENSSAVLHPEGSVILSRDAGVGKSAILACQMAVSQHFIVWTCDPRKLSNWFLYHLLQKLKPLFEHIASGSTIKTIGLPFFIGMRVTVPLIQEQKRIAACLSSLDALIAAQSRKLDGLRTHKKGLMQKIFPSPEGV